MLRSVDFTLRYEDNMLDFKGKTLEDYDIPFSGVIFIEDCNVDITVCLPTGNDKIFSLSKNKKVIDLKERIAV